MKRDLQQASNTHYDVIIVGGGIYGATLFWEATSRGLSAILLEKQDFGAATSANSLKIIHGGIRYLQHGDIPRLRESVRERRILMDTAPHLVHPLPVLVPTYGYSMKGNEAMWLGMLANDILSADRNWLDDPQKWIPRGRLLSKDDVLASAPALQQDGLRGAAMFHDARVYNSERHILAYVQSAVAAGGTALNYACVSGFLSNGATIQGVQVQDELGGDAFEIRGKLVINTSGPWINRLIDAANATEKPKRFAKAFNIVLPPIFEKYAVGISAPYAYRDTDALIQRGSRLLFFVPWRGYSMVGTEYSPYEGTPEDFTISAEEVQRFVDDIASAYPAAQFSLEDVSFVQRGLLPLDGLDARTGQVRLTKHYEIMDHRQQGVNNVVTVMGVKYTTARDVAERTINWVRRQYDFASIAPSVSAGRRLHGGEIERFEEYLQGAIHTYQDSIAAEHITSMVYNYGSCYEAVLHCADFSIGEATEVALARAQTRFAVQQEMAQTLPDVIFRRTDLGTAARPPADILQACLEEMTVLHQWTQAEANQQLEQVNQRYELH